MKQASMLDYIRQTPAATLAIVERREALFSEFSEQMMRKRYRRILLVASGTSYNACLTARLFLERMLQIPCQLMSSYCFAHYDETAMSEDLLLAVSHEGESTNTIDCLKKAKEKSIDHFIVTEGLDNTCSRLAERKVTIDCEHERIGPKTMGYTATVLTLQLMALEAAKKTKRLSKDDYEKYIERLQATLRGLNGIIDQSIAWFERNRDELARCQTCYILGYGAHCGTAMEGALKCMETVRSVFSAFETEEFLHGPYSSLKKNTHIIFLAPQCAGYRRAHSLYDFLSQHMEHVYSIGSQEGSASPHILAANFLNDENFSTLEYIVPLQLLAYLLYNAKQIDLKKWEIPWPGEELKTKAQDVLR